MDRKKVELIDKIVFLVLLILAAVAAVLSMVAGPFGHSTLSISCAASASVIGGGLLVHSIRAFRRKK